MSEPRHPPASGPTLPDDGLPLRVRFLRLKSVLHDQVTGLDAYPLHIDELHLLADERPVGVIAVELPTLVHLETIHGWEVCDRFLRQVADRLGSLRGRGMPDGLRVTLDGVHGDSFLVFLPETPRGRELSEESLGAAAEFLRISLDPIRLPPGRSSAGPHIDFSLGFALIGGNPGVRFERRLHQAIREARAMAERRNERLGGALAREFLSILREVRLTTHYQPIVDMERGSIMGYEALTRGPSNSSFEVPEALFSDANATSLLSELDVLCRHQAVRNARGFDRSKKLFLNSRPDTLASRGFVDGGFFDSLAEVELTPRNLVLEITERSAIRDFDAFERDLAPLRRQGFLVAIDDVGTGYSSLQTISEVQPDFLKIDISLIRKIHRSLIKQELVHSLLQIAAKIGARVIAEGIESEMECRALRRCGVQYGQGFYFAHPAPPFAPLDRHAAEPAGG
ncbi:MAG TPA: GGDEF domain-containing phosphodiesterase [Candidatus Polarisedimenticolia bacterium]|nr:GGDEF domain-containing phosphodiesterase [Candidatus Polarisedimenticolia bacterium]